jgi:hypothetical protein
MTREELLKLAHEAATEDGSTNREDGKNVVLYAAKTNRFLERFAALVAEAEREACAAVADKHSEECYVGDSDWYEARNIAKAIRARGNT